MKQESLAVAFVLLVALQCVVSGCGDRTAPTEPSQQAPDASGSWKGTLWFGPYRLSCSPDKTVAVTASFTQAGSQVTGSFHGPCLEGAHLDATLQSAFSGIPVPQRLRGGKLLGHAVSIDI